MNPLVSDTLPRTTRHTASTQLATYFLYFFSHSTATPEIYTLSLHDALPIWICGAGCCCLLDRTRVIDWCPSELRDRKSTRLNSSHEWISYAVFCLKKKVQVIRH